MKEDQLESLRHEVLQLLRFRIAFKRILELNDLNKISRSDWVDRLHALQAIETDMILRINKFGDKRRDVYSFKNLLKNRSISNASQKKLDQFYELIKPLKNRRDDQLAHLKRRMQDGRYIPVFDLDPAIRKIVEIMDDLLGKREEYHWHDGRYEKYEMREMLGF